MVSKGAQVTEELAGRAKLKMTALVVYHALAVLVVYHAARPHWLCSVQAPLKFSKTLFSFYSNE